MNSRLEMTEKTAAVGKLSEAQEIQTNPWQADLLSYFQSRGKKRTCKKKGREGENHTGCGLGPRILRLRNKKSTNLEIKNKLLAAKCEVYSSASSQKGEVQEKGRRGSGRRKGRRKGRVVSLGER